MIDGLGRDMKPVTDPGIAQPVDQATKDAHFTIGEAMGIVQRGGPGTTWNAARSGIAHALAQGRRSGRRAKPVEYFKGLLLCSLIAIGQGPGVFIGAIEVLPGRRGPLPIPADLQDKGCCAPSWRRDLLTR